MSFYRAAHIARGVADEARKAAKKLDVTPMRAVWFQRLLNDLFDQDAVAHWKRSIEAEAVDRVVRALEHEAGEDITKPTEEC